MVWDLPKVPKAEHVKLPYVSMYKAKDLTVTSDMLLTCHIDGEVAKAHKFEIKLFPQKLKVLTRKT
jgi:diacylglycerol kinase family enzyme